MLNMVGPGPHEKFIDQHQWQVGIVLVNFLSRGTELGVLCDRIGEDTGSAHDGPARNPPRYALDEFAIGPIDIGIGTLHVSSLSLQGTSCPFSAPV